MRTRDRIGHTIGWFVLAPALAVCLGVICPYLAVRDALDQARGVKRDSLLRPDLARFFALFGVALDVVIAAVITYT